MNQRIVIKYYNASCLLYFWSTYRLHLLVILKDELVQIGLMLTKHTNLHHLHHDLPSDELRAHRVDQSFLD